MAGLDRSKFERIYNAALEHQSERRAEFVRAECAGDDELRREVESLLGYDGAGLLQMDGPPRVGLPAGSRLGPYEIAGWAGAGGMGEVYKARDTRLNRTVAIKVLTGHLSANADFRLRLEREAKAVSALSHAHICTLYDVGHQNGIDYLVMEYLDGETLASRLAKVTLPLRDVLRYGVEIAEALAAAHRRGILHRDLKPGNIMLTKAGAKLLDFGLAKVAPVAGTAPDAASETELTENGTLLGTLPYMSPEQVHGKPLDFRSDVFSFGAVLYEMAAGRAPFAADSRAGVIAAVLDREPEPPSKANANIPPALEKLIQACLIKDREERQQSMHDAAQALAWIEAGAFPQIDSAHLSRPKTGGRRMALALGVLTVGVLAALAVWRWFILPGAGGAAPVRAVVQLPNGLDIYLMGGLLNLAIAPDGSRMVVSAIGQDGKPSLWLRPLHSTEFYPLSDTEDAVNPFWSPDSRQIGFFAKDNLKRIAVDGAVSQILAKAPDSVGGSWAEDGSILFTSKRQILRTDASGATPVVVMADEKFVFCWPQWLPGSRKFLFDRFLLVGGQTGDTYVASLDSTQPPTLLLKEVPRATYARPGYLFFVRDQTLMARRFDLKAARIFGDEYPIAEGVCCPFGLTSTVSVSDNGVVAFYQMVPQITKHPAWFRRTGERMASAAEPGRFAQVALAPDGAHVVFESGYGLYGPAFPTLSLLDLKSGVQSTLCSGDLEGGCSDPVWFSDSRRVLYSVNYRWPKGRHELYEVSIDSHRPKLLSGTPNTFIFPSDISLDSQSAALIYGNDGVVGLYSFASRSLRQLPAAPGSEQVRFSPDGKWLAFDSLESGRWEVYVAALPDLAPRRQVSSNGGMQPVWKRNGGELFYLTLDGKMMSVSVSTRNGLQTGTPKTLFQGTISRRDLDPVVNQYDVTADGEKFLILESTTTAAEPIHLILNWTAALPKR